MRNAQFFPENNILSKEYNQSNKKPNVWIVIILKESQDF